MPLPIYLAIIGALAAAIGIATVYRMIFRPVSDTLSTVFTSTAQLSATAAQTASTASEHAATVAQVTAAVQELHKMSLTTT